MIYSCYNHIDSVYIAMWNPSPGGLNLFHVLYKVDHETGELKNYKKEVIDLYNEPFWRLFVLNGDIIYRSYFHTYKFNTDILEWKLQSDTDSLTLLEYQHTPIRVGNYMFPIKNHRSSIMGKSTEDHRNIVPVFHCRASISWMCKLDFPENHETAFIEKVKEIFDISEDGRSEPSC